MDIKSLPEEFQELGEGLAFFALMTSEMREFASNIAKGELDCPLPSHDNELSSDLKMLHSALKHLAWQTKQVANGDYNQKVSFMGEFADSFNEMVRQLKDRQENLLGEMEKIKHKTDELARSNSLFETITTMMPEWIVMIDRETGEHLFANHPATKNLATPLFEEQLYQILFESAQEINDKEDFKQEEFPLLSDNAIQWFNLIMYPVNWYGHKAVAAVLVDITEEKEQIEELENVAYKDMLTGCYNRHYGMKLLDEWIKERKHFIICFVDMDRLKYVNDVFGHLEGDQYIIQVANLLGKYSHDAVVCRLGGDEFMMIVPDNTEAQAVKRMEALRDELSKEEHISDKKKAKYKRSISYGVVEVAPNNRTSANILLTLADEKMYEYKRAHKAERRD